MTNKRNKPSYRHRLLEIMTLQTPSSRLIVFAVLSILIFLAPYNWLANLSLWQYLGIDSPSIGLTRSYWLLIHGDFVAAWDKNKLIFLVLAVGLPIIARDCYLTIKDLSRIATKHFN